MKKNSVDLLHPQLKTLLLLSEDYIIVLDTHYCIIDFNESAKSLLRWKEHEILGKSLESIYQEYPDNVPFPFEKFKALSRGKDFNFSQIMYRNKSKRYVNWKFISQPEQSVIIILGNDKTDKKRLALQNITIFDQIKKISLCVPGNFYWKNKEEQYLGCNQTLLQTLGFKSLHELVGKTDLDLWPAHAEELKKNDEMVIREKNPVFFEETVTLSGKIRFFTVIKMPLLDDEGNIIGILGNSLDITELKNAQTELNKAKEAAEAASHAKTEFIANMSHDIRTPLTGVVGMSKMLEESLQDPNQKQYAHWLNESGKQLLHMLNGILDVVSADNVHDSDVHEEAFNLHQVIQDIVQLERPSTLIKGLQLVTYVDENIPSSLISDATKIHRILLNLLGNAIKFTQVGQVEINVLLLGQDETDMVVQFRIKDTGIGISTELQDKVFDRFYRGTPSHKGTYTGHGIGLHIAKSYADLLGGKISFTSKQGIGTTFCFTLALKIDDSQLKSTPSKSDGLNTINPTNSLKISTSNKKEPKLLLVEDNKVALFTLENLISQAGLKFISVMDGESALHLSQSESFDLIITDLGLPDLSGIELTSRIRTLEKEERKRPIPIIGLTAHSEEKIKKSCLESGMDKVFTKPMTLDILMKIKEIYFDPTQAHAASEHEANLAQQTQELSELREELLKLEKSPVFDAQYALVGIGGDINLLKDILASIIEKEIPIDISELEKAYMLDDWSTIGKVIHRMKSSFIYCGATQLVHLCQYIEHYSKEVCRQLPELLYQQLFIVINETKKQINDWLSLEQ